MGSGKTGAGEMGVGEMGISRLKLGTHVDREQMYCVYRKQTAAAYLSLYFSNSKMFRHTFLRNCEA